MLDLTGPRKVVGRRKRAHAVSEAIEQAIADGEFKIGDRLPTEKELMRRFEVGRPAVREALFFLEQQGIIEIVNGARARVIPLSPKLIVQQFNNLTKRIAIGANDRQHAEQARLSLEAGVAWLAATVATDDDIVRLKAALDANIAAVGNRVEFIRTDVAFHYELAVITGNPIFKMIYEVVVDWLVDQRTTSYRIVDADGFSVRDHSAIYAAVAARHPARAFHEMASHIQLIGRLHTEAARLSSEILRRVTIDVAARFDEEKEARWATSFGAAPTVRKKPETKNRKALPSPERGRK